MPTLAVTRQEFQIILAGLPGGGGIQPRDRPLAEQLRLRLNKTVNYYEPPKAPIISSSWPTGFVKAEKKKSWDWNPEKSSKVNLNNSTTQEKIDDILKGLI